MVENMSQTRADHDYPGVARHLAAVPSWRTPMKLKNETWKFKKDSNPSVWSNISYYMDFRFDESILLSLLLILLGVWSHVCQNSLWFLGKVGSYIFLKYTPYSQQGVNSLDLLICLSSSEFLNCYIYKDLHFYCIKPTYFLSFSITRTQTPWLDRLV